MKKDHATKSGPGRRHKDGTYRNGKHHGKAKPMGFADAIQNAAAVKRASVHPLRDAHGAYCMVGRDPLRRVNLDGEEVRRKWLAGISAQRGY